MARTLARAGIPVRAWNRTRERIEPLAAEGVELAGTPAEAAAEAGIVLTILSDADTVIEVMEGDGGALAEMGAESLWLQMSTLGLSGTERCLTLAENRDVALIDAPVLGTKAPAEAGDLVVLGSGPDELRGRVEPVFDAVGKRTLWVGEAGAGTRLKLVTNTWILAVVEGAAEALSLAEGLDLDPKLLFEAVEGGPLDLPYLRAKGAAMLARDFEPSFKLALAAKDAGLVAEAAAERGLDLPLVETVRRRFEETVDQHGDDDMSAVYMTSTPIPAA
jgi:3-hydroxyisobutyrate dehydrogenase